MAALERWKRTGVLNALNYRQNYKLASWVLRIRIPLNTLFNDLSPAFDNDNVPLKQPGPNGRDSCYGRHSLKGILGLGPFLSLPFASSSWKGKQLRSLLIPIDLKATESTIMDYTLYFSLVIDLMCFDREIESWFIVLKNVNKQFCRPF